MEPGVAATRDVSLEGIAVQVPAATSEAEALRRHDGRSLDPERRRATEGLTAAGRHAGIGADGKRAYTVEQIAAEFGVTRPTIYRHLIKTPW